MKELYFGALDLSPYLESITNGYILNLRGVPDALQGEMLLMISQAMNSHGVSFFCVFGGFKMIARIGYIRSKNLEYWLFMNEIGYKLAFQFLK